MEIKVLLVIALFLVVVFFFMYWDYRKNFGKIDMSAIDLEKLKKGLSDELNEKPIVDLTDAVKYNNERRK